MCLFTVIVCSALLPSRAETPLHSCIPAFIFFFLLLLSFVSFPSIYRVLPLSRSPSRVLFLSAF